MEVIVMPDGESSPKKNELGKTRGKTHGNDNHKTIY